MLDVTRLLAKVVPGTALTLSVPLACFRRLPGLASVAGPIELRTEGKLALSLTDVRFAAVRRQGCAPTLEAEK